MNHTKKIRICLSICWAGLGVALVVLIWYATNYIPLLRSPLSVILFVYAILTPAIVAGMVFLKHREKKSEPAKD